MNGKNKHYFQKMEYLIHLIGEKTRNLFVTKQLMCSESVLTVLNQSLSGGLETGLAVRLTSGLPEGLGGSGCTCGALTGGIISLGVFLGRSKPGIYNNKIIMNVSKELHDSFKKTFSATCCRVLTKNLKHGSKEQFKKGSVIVRFSSEKTARLILQEIPELVSIADFSYLEQSDSPIKSNLKKIANFIS